MNPMKKYYPKMGENSKLYEKLQFSRFLVGTGQPIKSPHKCENLWMNLIYIFLLSSHTSHFRLNRVFPGSGDYCQS